MQNQKSKLPHYAGEINENSVKEMYVEIHHVINENAILRKELKWYQQSFTEAVEFFLDEKRKN